MCNVSRCFCFDLRTGTLIIAVVDLVFGVLGVVQSFASNNPSYAMGTGQKVLAVLGIVAAVLLIIGVQKVTTSF